MRLGAPVFVQTQDPAELAKAHKELGYGAAYCPGPVMQDPSDENIKAFREAFAKENIVIAEVGAWCNPMTPVEAERKKNLQLIIDRLSIADRIGARCCVDYAGSFSAEHSAGPHPKDLSKEAFDLVVENTRKIIDAVKPTNSTFTLEMMQWMWPDSPDAYLDLMKAVDREAFAVHLDPTNLINSPRRYYYTGDVIRECIEKLGPKIMSAHAKDVTMAEKHLVHIDETPPGTGLLDYKTYITGLAKLPQDVPLMVEHLKGPEAYADAVKHIRGVAKECGVEL
ncbi:MAG: sugar phosphate isomerase/epimerase [Planctomycetes bacterium]|nr:sugar phosphate isomerase/epimerase [Planctomycetota bacterium]